MKNYLASIRMFACLVGLALLLVSCDDAEKSTAQSPVVRKKFSAQNDRTQPAPKVAPAAAPKPAAAESPPAAAESKPLVAEVKPAPPGVPAPAPKELAPPAPATPPAAVPAPQPAGTAPVPVRPATESKKPDLAMTVTDAQVAALLNIQAPPPYNPQGKVDPFEPLLKDDSAQVARALKPKKRTPQTPLEQVDLGQLKLVAIIAAPSGNRALVEESSGKGYILKEGTFVGLNAGKVVNISINKVMIEEEFEDVYGKTITQKKEITLPKPPGEL